MAVAWVQAKSIAGFSGTQLSITFDSNVTAGNWILLAFGWGGNTSTATVAKTGGTSTVGTVAYANNPTADAVGASAGMAYVEVTGTGTLTLTVTISATVSGRTFVGHEISGCAAAPFHKSAMQAQTNPGTGTDAVTSGSVTTTVDGCYIFGYTYNTAGFQAASGTNFTSRESNVRYVSEDLIQAAAGSIAATFTQSGAIADPITGVMAFAPPVAGGLSIPVEIPAGMSRGTGRGLLRTLQ